MKTVARRGKSERGGWRSRQAGAIRGPRRVPDGRDGARTRAGSTRDDAEVFSGRERGNRRGVAPRAAAVGRAGLKKSCSEREIVGPSFFSRHVHGGGTESRRGRRAGRPPGGRARKARVRGRSLAAYLGGKFKRVRMCFLARRRPVLLVTSTGVHSFVEKIKHLDADLRITTRDSRPRGTATRLEYLGARSALFFSVERTIRNRIRRRVGQIETERDV